MYVQVPSAYIFEEDVVFHQDLDTVLPQVRLRGGFWEEMSLESLKGRSLLTKPLPPSRLKITRGAPGGEQAEGVGAPGGRRRKELRAVGLTTLAGLKMH